MKLGLDGNALVDTMHRRLVLVSDLSSESLSPSET